MKTKIGKQLAERGAQPQVPDKIVESEKLTRKYRRQTKNAAPERRIVNRFRESHREPGVNPPRGQ
jgi:hypothetical protein